MLQLENKTPFAAILSILPNEQGIDTVFVIVSARFNLGKQWLLDEEQPTPTEADEYYGEPGKSSVKRPSEYHLGKPASDIIMLGDACAPEGQQVRQLDVSLQVGRVSKVVRVFGDRFYQNGQVFQPELFERMPLSYERSYGGSHYDSEGLLLNSEERNPIGRGYRYIENVDDLKQNRLPNIENPDHLIKGLGRASAPTGFGAIAPYWQPRVGYAGTYDDQWCETRAPYLPLDFDKRFFNCAADGLVYPGFLSGGERVAITGMHPKGTLNFQLPHVNLLSRADIAGALLPMNFNLETLILEPNDLALSMTWRASIAVGKRLSKLKSVELVISRQTEVA